MLKAGHGLEGCRGANNAGKCAVSKVYWILKENREKRYGRWAQLRDLKECYEIDGIFEKNVQIFLK